VKIQSVSVPMFNRNTREKTGRFAVRLQEDVLKLLAWAQTGRLGGDRGGGCDGRAVVYELGDGGGVQKEIRHLRENETPSIQKRAGGASGEGARGEKVSKDARRRVPKRKLNEGVVY